MSDLVVGDPHLNDNPRDAYRHKFFADVLPGILADRRPDRLIVTGDITDEKDRHSAWLVNKVVSHFHMLTSHVPEIVILKGNHDYEDENNPFFHFLNRIPGLRFVSHVVRRQGILFLPHTTDYKCDWAERKEAPLAYAHNTFEGALGGNATKLHGVPLEACPATTVISGDVHVPQTLGKVVYVGAPYRIDFGDDFEPRLLLVHLTNNWLSSWTSIPTGELVPQKRLLEMANVEERKAPNCRPGDILKIRVNLKYRDVADWQLVKEYAGAVGLDKATTKAGVRML
jgi:DNA repair exonuclease SbcCD nuclease subunit